MFDIFNMVMFAIGKPTSNCFFHQNHSQVLVPLRPTTTRKEVQKVGVLADELLHRGFFGRKGLLFLNRHAIENYLLLGLNQQRVRQIRNAIWEKGSGLGAEWEGEDEELNIFGSLLYFKVKQQRIVMRSKQRRTYKPELFSPQLPRNTGSSSLSEQVSLLLRENSELKQEIIELKVHQFYQFDDKKLKELITQTEKLRKDVKSLKEEVKELQTVNDFLKRTNTHLKGELEKEIGRRKKESAESRGREADREKSRGRGADRGESKNGESRLMKESRMMASKQTDHTRNTDCSQDQFSHMSSHAHFYLLQNTTLDEAFKQAPAAEYQPPQSQRQPRKSLMQKILSPRRGKQRSPNNQSNEYLLYRRQKDRQQKE